MKNIAGSMPAILNLPSEREETSKIVLNEQRSRMPLPPALQARLAKRGIIQKGKSSF